MKQSLQTLSLICGTSLHKLIRLKLSTHIMRKLEEETYPNWTTYTRTILDDIRKGYMWDIVQMQNSKTCSGMLKRALKEKAWDSCQTYFNESEKCSFYKELLARHKPGKPASHFKLADTRNCDTITRFKLRNHRLAVETGDWLNIDMRERKCFTCGVLENEAHFLQSCVRYTHERGKYITRLMAEHGHAEAQELLICDSNKCVDNIAIFIRKCTKLHQEYAEQFLARVNDISTDNDSN